MNRRNALKALFIGAPAAGLAMAAAPAIGYHSGGYVGERGPELILPKGGAVMPVTANATHSKVAELKITIDDSQMQDFMRLWRKEMDAAIRRGGAAIYGPRHPR